MKKLLIYNNVSFHYEIIESVIIKYREILNIYEENDIDIYLYVVGNNIFVNYIKNKYPKIIFKKIDNYDYYINCTIYDNDFNNLKLDTNKRFISHEITERLKNHPNVVFLTPLSIKNYFIADILPFKNNKHKYNIPIYIIQGSIQRRNHNLLVKILEKKYNYNFLIKIIGFGNNFPNMLSRYKDKITFHTNLSFIDYHKQFLNVYCILPLVSKKLNPSYYKNKLTSSINYAIGYDLKCLIDKDLQNIYNLKNSEVYNDENDICASFEKTLIDFYN